MQNREQKEGEKEGSNVDGQVCAGVASRNRNCVFSGTGANLNKPGAGLAGQKPVRNN